MDPTIASTRSQSSALSTLRTRSLRIWLIAMLRMRTRRWSLLGLRLSKLDGWMLLNFWPGDTPLPIARWTWEIGFEWGKAFKSQAVLNAWLRMTWTGSNPKGCQRAFSFSVHLHEALDYTVIQPPSFKVFNALPFPIAQNKSELSVPSNTIWAANSICWSLQMSILNPKRNKKRHFQLRVQLKSTKSL